jgi:hypothetical protein
MARKKSTPEQELLRLSKHLLEQAKRQSEAIKKLEAIYMRPCSKYSIPETAQQQESLRWLQSIDRLAAKHNLPRDQKVKMDPNFERNGFWLVDLN